MFRYKVQFRLHVWLYLSGYNLSRLSRQHWFPLPFRIGANPFPMQPVLPSSEYYGLVRLPTYLLCFLPFFGCLQITIAGIGWFSQVPITSICYLAIASDPGKHCRTCLIVQQNSAFQFMNTVGSSDDGWFRGSILSLALRPDNSHLPAPCLWLPSCM
ncbi:MAG: hypothetical protein DDT40_01471 [candidate division WS2 bacterium]|nr:hypothetical protein [Candidatus Psychracetigena formicireducens]